MGRLIASEGSANVIDADVGHGFVDLVLHGSDDAEEGDHRLDRWAAGLGALQLCHEHREVGVIADCFYDQRLDPECLRIVPQRQSSHNDSSIPLRLILIY